MTEMNKYLKKMFGVDDASGLGKCDNRVTEALERAHDIRKFEIDLYWRRGLYFWGFNLTIFASFGFLLSKMAGWNDALLPVSLPALALALLGLFISTVWFFVHKGSKAWQQNWEYHIDFLEESVTGNLHKTTLGKRADFFSVSKANQYVIYGIGFFWFAASTYLLALMTYPDLDQSLAQAITNCLLLTLVPLVLVVATVALFHFCCRTGDETFGEASKRNKAKKFKIYRRGTP